MVCKLSMVSSASCSRICSFVLFPSSSSILNSLIVIDILIISTGILLDINIFLYIYIPLKISILMINPPSESLSLIL